MLLFVFKVIRNNTEIIIRISGTSNKFIIIAFWSSWVNDEMITIDGDRGDGQSRAVDGYSL